MSLRPAKRRSTDGDLDMTPMVDVTFLLLIFFMITSAFEMQKSFEMPTPTSDQASTQAKTLEDYEEDPDFVTVRVDEFNTFYVASTSWEDEEEALSSQDLLIKLRRARNTDGASRMMILANGEATHQRVVQAIDAGNEVGLEDVKLVTVESDY